MGRANSNVVSVTVPSPPTCATPVPSPAPGTYSSAQSVTATCSTPASDIWFTDDGSTPNVINGVPQGTTQLYTGAIAVPSTVTLNFLGTAFGYLNSAVAGGTYTINTLPAVTLTISLSNHVQGGHLFNDNILSWNNIGAPAANYRILRQINGGGFSTLTTIAVPGNDYFDSAVAATYTFGEYDYQIQVLDSGNNVIETTNTVTATWVDVTSGTNAAGPIPGGSPSAKGYFDGTTGAGSGSAGSIAPSAPKFDGIAINAACWLENGGIITNPDGAFALILSGSHPQNLFTQWQFVADSSSETLTSSSATYSTSAVPGFTLWYWSASSLSNFTDGNPYQMGIY